MSKKLIKKWSLIILLLGVVFIGLGGKCPFKGKDGSDGRSGSSGVISINYYFFTPVGNPHEEIIPEISFEGVGEGWQAVTVYYSVLGTDWVELPQTELLTGSLYEHVAIIWDEAVTVETYEDGVSYAGDALFGNPCMVTVRTYNH